MPDLLSIEYWRMLVQKGGKSCSWLLAAVFGLPLIIGLGWNQFLRGDQHDRTSANSVIAKVNGDTITESDYQQALRSVTQGQMPPAGRDFAMVSGRAVYNLIGNAVFDQEAERRHVRPTAAEIDRTIDKQKQQILGKNGTENDWDSYLAGRNMTAAEYREFIAKAMIPVALQDAMKNSTNVSDADAKAQYDEYKLTDILVPSINASPNMASFPRKPKPLPDADAQKEADDLLAKAKAGADLAQLAGTYSGDPMTSKKGGETGWIDAQKLAFYGPDFADAVKKTPKGQFTGVFKVPGFMSGYLFARVEDMREKLPKDFNLRQTLNQMRDQRVEKDFEALGESLVKKAKIDFVDPDKKAYYDYVRAQMDERMMMMAQFGQAVPNAPTEDQVKKEQEVADREMLELAKRRPDDSTAAIIARDTLKRQLAAAAPNQRAAVEAELIKLGESVLRSTEDHEVRFDLVDEYLDSGHKDLAKAQLDKLDHLLNIDQGYNVDLAGMQKEEADRQKLMADYRRIGETAAADKEQARVAVLDVKIKAEQQKQAEEQKEQAEAQKKLAAEEKKRPGSTSSAGTLTLPGDSTAGSTVTIPAPSAPAAPAPKTGAAPAAPNPATKAPANLPAPPASGAPPAAGK